MNPFVFARRALLSPLAGAGALGLPFAALLALASCELAHEIGARDSVRLPVGSGKASWTILVYMSADNELESYALRDLNAMESVDAAGSGIRIIALVDRAEGYDTSDGDWTGTRLYELEHDADGMNARIVSRRLASPELDVGEDGKEELDLGDPGVLQGLLAFAARSYPADHCALILWGHGSGWRALRSESAEAAGIDGSLTPREPRLPGSVLGSRAVGFDEGSGGDLLTTREIGRALEGERLDLVGFDTCSTAMIEVAYELRSACTFLVASEDLVAAAGWDYPGILTRFSSSPMEPADLAASIVTSYAEGNADSAGATISALELGEVPAVMSAFNTLCDAAWRATTDTSTQTALRRAIFEDCEAFYATPGDLNVDLVDLAAVVGGVLPEAAPAAERLEEAVGAALAAEWHHSQGHPRAHGLAVHYVPLAADGTPLGHDLAYFRGAPVADAPAFMQASSWPPVYPGGPGLLYRIWYESLER